MFRYALVSILFISSTGIASANWYKDSKKDPFDDQDYVMFRSQANNGVFLSLTCGATNYAKYNYPRVVVHDTKDTWTSITSGKNIHLRVDKNKAIEIYGYNDSNKEAPYYWNTIEEGNERGKRRENIELITKQLFAGNTVLIAIGDKSPVSLSLKGVTAAAKKMDNLCKAQVGKDGRLKKQHKTSNTSSPIWIKT